MGATDSAAAQMIWHHPVLLGGFPPFILPLSFRTHLGSRDFVFSKMYTSDMVYILCIGIGIGIGPIRLRSTAHGGWDDMVEVVKAIILERGEKQRRRQGR